MPRRYLEAVPRDGLCGVIFPSEDGGCGKPEGHEGVHAVKLTSLLGHTRIHYWDGSFRRAVQGKALGRVATGVVVYDDGTRGTWWAWVPLSRRLSLRQCELFPVPF